MTETGLALAMLGSVGSFIDFHKTEEGDFYIEEGDTRNEVIAKQALRVAIETLGEDRLHAFRALPRPERDRCIALLRAQGLSVRQIERLTGVGRNIIAKIGT